jgi:nitroreductase
MPVDLSGQAIPAAKHAQTSFEVLPPIRNRWSPRAFLPKPVPAATLRVLLEAARWAASCFNEQPWRFIVATKERPEEYAKLLSVLVEKNQRWAGTAPVLMLSVASKSFAHNKKPNRHDLHDTGAAAATMAIQAASMGLQIHQMAGFDVAKAREVFGIPEEFEPGAAIAVGYPGPPDAVGEEFRAGEIARRVRRPLEEFVFGAKWGEAAQI